MARARRPDAYLVELGAGVVVLAAVNLLLVPGDPGFLGVQPHPALFLAAILGTRQGLRDGLIGSALLAALLLACAVWRADALTPATFGRLPIYVTPLLVVATGFVLGAVAEVRRREKGDVVDRMAALEQELADQAVRFMAASEARHELERRVAEETASLTHLYTAARAMETLDLERLYPAVASTLRKFLQADACQLYLVDGGRLVLKAAEGAAPLRGDLAVDDGLVGLAVRRGRPVSIRDFATVSSLDDLQSAPMLLAAPLIGRDAALLGCVTVTKLPFLRLNVISLERMGVVADWAARSLENALVHQKTAAMTITDELVRAYTYAYFQRRLEEEEARADRYGRPLTVIVFKIGALELVRPERRPDLARLLGLVFSRSLRSIDLVCRYATDDSFAILLPETPAAEAQAVADRLASEVGNFAFKPYVDEERALESSVRVLVVREAK